MSMISTLDEVGTTQSLGGMVKTVRVLYTSRRETDSNGRGAEILFETRLRDIARKWERHEHVDYKYSFFETSAQASDEQSKPGNMSSYPRRISKEDLFKAVGPEDSRANTVVYVCGLPAMTDEFVELLKTAPGMDEKRVLCEKWW